MSATTHNGSSIAIDSELDGLAATDRHAVRTLIEANDHFSNNDNVAEPLCRVQTLDLSTDEVKITAVLDSNFTFSLTNTRPDLPDGYEIFNVMSYGRSNGTKVELIRDN